ncbi:hypothetical protein [Paenibacillus sp. J2TS4]|uniref:hypothetical protein n=1 Tax=Paenibacillus sp. J2TS4 TaxID=2807194 RepID=UPI001B10D401|nr:hypothetical protein [Paenibacillus sp. J2TS4]GIP34289.1 hypothetical protein J2TS4_34990 [Paenibacillus sp. J2TS4]
MIDVWGHWSLNRLLILFVALAFLLIGLQVTFSHYRQNFHHKAMWFPVIESPLIFLAGLGLAFSPSGFFRFTFVFLLLAGVLIGIAGVYFHFKGVGVRVGGYASRNFLVGPPVVLPVVYIAMCVLGLIAVYWR